MARRLLVVAIGFGLVLACLTLVLQNPTPPHFEKYGAVWFKPLGNAQRFQLTEQQAASFRRILASPAQFETSSDPVLPTGFFFLDGKSIYWRGIGLRLNPESGPHWHWRGGKCLEAMSSCGSSRDLFQSEIGIRKFLSELDPQEHTEH